MLPVTHRITYGGPTFLVHSRNECATADSQSQGAFLTAPEAASIVATDHALECAECVTAQVRAVLA